MLAKCWHGDWQPVSPHLRWLWFQNIHTPSCLDKLAVGWQFFSKKGEIVKIWGFTVIQCLL